MPFPRELPKKREPVNYRFVNRVSAILIAYSLGVGGAIIYFDATPKRLRWMIPKPNSPEGILLESDREDRLTFWQSFVGMRNLNAERELERIRMDKSLSIGVKSVAGSKEFQSKLDTLEPGIHQGQVTFSRSLEKEKQLKTEEKS